MYRYYCTSKECVSVSSQIDAGLYNFMWWWIITPHSSFLKKLWRKLYCGKCVYVCNKNPKLKSTLVPQLSAFHLRSRRCTRVKIQMSWKRPRNTLVYTGSPTVSGWSLPFSVQLLGSDMRGCNSEQGPSPIYKISDQCTNIYISIYTLRQMTGDTWWWLKELKLKVAFVYAYISHLIKNQLETPKFCATPPPPLCGDTN